jgi:hypothetical protein
MFTTFNSITNSSKALSSRRSKGFKGLKIMKQNYLKIFQQRILCLLNIRKKTKAIKCKFPLFFFILFSSQGLAQIMLPPPPQTILPPRAKSTFEKSLRTKRKNRDKREKKNQPPVPKPSEKRDQKLFSEALKKRPLSFAIDSSLLIAGVVTSGNRTNYTTDPTDLFRVFWRNDQKKKTDQNQLWLGFRMAQFAGTGIMDKTPGRYGFSFIGPMIGVGNISLGKVSSGVDLKNKKQLANAKFPIRTGWLLAGGIAGISKLATVDHSGGQSTPEDFDGSKGVSFEAPGIWAEFSYIKIHFGALGVHYTAGLQMAKQKNFIYAGAALAGWY